MGRNSQILRARLSRKGEGKKRGFTDLSHGTHAKVRDLGRHRAAWGFVSADEY